MFRGVLVNKYSMSNVEENLTLLLRVSKTSVPEGSVLLIHRVITIRREWSGREWRLLFQVTNEAFGKTNP